MYAGTPENSVVKHHKRGFWSLSLGGTVSRAVVDKSAYQRAQTMQISVFCVLRRIGWALMRTLRLTRHRPPKPEYPRQVRRAGTHPPGRLRYRSSVSNRTLGSDVAA